MTNSLILFLGTLVFLTFGYLSLVRIARNAHSSANQATKSETLPFIAQLFNHLGQGGLFIHFITLSLLLFWGWGTALLWLILFHLIAETTVNLQQSTVRDESLDSGFIRFIHWVFLILILSVGTALLIKLINQQSGLVFILLAVFIAHAFIVEEITKTTVLMSLLVLVGGLWFSHELGIAIYGSVSPLDGFISQSIIRDYFVWLNFDNNSVISLTIIIGIFMLSRREHFRSDVSILSGVLTLVLLCAFIIKLFWLRPIVDAPMHSLPLREDGLPPFSSVALFLCGGLSILLLRELPFSIGNANKTANAKTNTSKTSSFANLQLSSLTLLLVALLLALALASALGIGAWSTHYQDWKATDNLNAHFQLAIRSAVDLINSQSKAGNLIYSLFSSGLAVVGFSCLLNIATKLTPQKKPISEDKESLLDKLKGSAILPVLLVYIASSLLVEHGIKIELWLLVGMLAWLLVTSRIVKGCITYQSHILAQGDSDNKGSHRSQLAQNSIALLLMVAGSIQLIWTSIRWGLSEQWVFVGLAGVILIAAIIIWKGQIKSLIAPFKNNGSPTLFR